MPTDVSLSGLVTLFGDLSKDLQSQPSLDSALELITTRGMRAVPGAEDAAVSKARNGRFETVGATSDLPLRVDRIQYELGSGPCVDAMLDDTVFRTGDLLNDERWPEFGRRASAETGVRSMLSLRLFHEDDDLIAGLNFYATALDAFSGVAELTGTLLATHMSIALTSARRQESISNLKRALASNREIGMAIGILMSTHKITRDQAFDLVRVASQHTNRKVSELAQQVVLTGTLQLPGV